jgi:hypothetical protein
MNTHTFRWGANTDPRCLDKNGAYRLAEPQAWTPTNGTMTDLATHIASGHAWMPVLLDKGARRNKISANTAEVLVLDIDEGLTIAEAIALIGSGHPVWGSCGLIIESASSTPEREKFRAVFALKEHLVGYELIERAIGWMLSQVPEADQKCSTPQFFFHGATGRSPQYIDTAAILELPIEQVAALPLKSDKKRKAPQAGGLRIDQLAVPVSRSRGAAPASPGELQLVACLGPNDRALLEGGVGEGSRNSTAFSLGANLLGTAGYLDSIGQRYSGNPEQLYNDFCDRCSPAIDDNERATTWASVERSNPGPSLTTDKIENCIAAWKTKSQTTERPRVAQTASGQQLGLASSKPAADIDADDAIDPAEMVELRAIQDAGDFPIETLVPPKLSEPIRRFANALNLPAGPFLGAILAVAASCLSTETTISLSQETGHKLNAVLWVVLVGLTGSAKSLIHQTAFKPLQSLQAEAHKEYQEAKKEHEAALSDWEKAGKDPEKRPAEPLMHEHYMSDFTKEALATPLANQAGRGMLVANDELAGFFKSFDQYRGGKGADLQFWLSAFNGDGIKVNRVSREVVFVEKTAISIVGTIQDKTLDAVMKAGGLDEGLWTRPIFINVPDVILPYGDDSPSIDISNWLNPLYRHLALMPAVEYSLSPEARKVWRDFHYWIQDKKLSTSGDVRGLYPKALTNAARFALVAHCVGAAIEGNGHSPPKQIGAETVRAAIAFTKWALNQNLLRYAQFDLSEADPRAARAVGFAKKHDGKQIKWQAARSALPRVTQRGKTPRRANKTECLEFFGELVKLGLGSFVGDGEILVKYQESPTPIHPVQPDDDEIDIEDYRGAA